MINEACVCGIYTVDSDFISRCVPLFSSTSSLPVVDALASLFHIDRSISYFSFVVLLFFSYVHNILGALRASFCLGFALTSTVQIEHGWILV